VEGQTRDENRPDRSRRQVDCAALQVTNTKLEVVVVVVVVVEVVVVVVVA